MEGTGGGTPLTVEHTTAGRNRGARRGWTAARAGVTGLTGLQIRTGVGVIAMGGGVGGCHRGKMGGGAPCRRATPAEGPPLGRPTGVKHSLRGLGPHFFKPRRYPPAIPSSMAVPRPRLCSLANPVTPSTQRPAPPCPPVAARRKRAQAVRGVRRRRCLPWGSFRHIFTKEKQQR